MRLMVSTTIKCNRSNAPMRSPDMITIGQQNVNRSSTCQHNLISSTVLTRRGIDIVALQEPAISKFGTLVASRDWVLVYPTNHSKDPFKTRSLLLIRSNILTEQWKQVEFPSGDITIVQLSSRWGEVTIFSIYNDCGKNNTISQIEAFMQVHISPPGQHIEGSKPVLWCYTRTGRSS